MAPDLTKILESKRLYRARLAALPIEEKLRMLDDLRERLVSIRGAVSVCSSTVESYAEANASSTETNDK